MSPRVTSPNEEPTKCSTSLVVGHVAVRIFSEFFEEMVKAPDSRLCHA
jgi:hypothetical protein